MLENKADKRLDKILKITKRISEMEKSNNNNLLESLEILENGIKLYKGDGAKTYVRTKINDLTGYSRLLGELNRQGGEGNPLIVERPDLFARGIGVLRKDDEGNEVFWIEREVVKQVTEMLKAA